MWLTGSWNSQVRSSLVMPSKYLTEARKQGGCRIEDCRMKGRLFTLTPTGYFYWILNHFKNMVLSLFLSCVNISKANPLSSIEWKLVGKRNVPLMNTNKTGCLCMLVEKKQSTKMVENLWPSKCWQTIAYTILGPLTSMSMCGEQQGPNF